MNAIADDYFCQILSEEDDAIKNTNFAFGAILTICTAAAQTTEPSIDSLLNALKLNKSEQNKMKIYSELAMVIYRRNADSGLALANKAFALNAKYQDKKIEADIHYGVALNYIVKSDYSKSLSNLYKSLAIYETLPDSIFISRTLNIIGVVFASSGDFDKGTYYAQQALDISTKLNLKTEMVKNLSNLGEMNLILQRISKANEYFYQAIAINKNIDDKAISMSLYTSIGNAYAQSKQYDTAIKYYKTAIKLAKALNRSINEGYISMQIANIYYNSATDSSAVRNIGSTNSKHRNLSIAIDYLNYSKTIFLNIQSINEIKDVYHSLYTMHKALGRSDSALHYFEMATVMNDSANKIETTRKLAKQESDRILSVKEVQLKKAESDTMASRRLVYIIAIISIAIALALVWASITLKNKKKLLSILEEKNAAISAANIELDSLSKHLQEANATKDKFFSIIAHDLKSPFSGFINLTKFMSENIDEFSREELIDSSRTLNQSAVKLFKLLENLLEWSRLQRGITEFKPCSLSVHELVEDCLSVLQSIANQKGIAIHNRIDNTLTISADYRMIETLFRNLISNAIKFTPIAGEIEIGISPNESEKFITIYVKDGGIGIPTNIIDKLFTLGEYTSRLGTEGESSSGLGLILVKEFVEKHGGIIWVESEEGKGSNFYFTLPK